MDFISIVVDTDSCLEREKRVDFVSIVVDTDSCLERERE